MLTLLKTFDNSEEFFCFEGKELSHTKDIVSQSYRARQWQNFSRDLILHVEPSTPAMVSQWKAAGEDSGAVGWEECTFEVWSRVSGS